MAKKIKRGVKENKAGSGTVKKSDVGPVISDEEALRLTVAKAQQAMIKKACKDNVENFTAASQALEDFLARKNAGPDERRFKNMLEVVDYLKGEGWKIEKSKAYKDRKSGLIQAQGNGTFMMSDVEKYIVRAELKKADGVDPKTNMQERKSEAEILRLEKQAKYWEHKVDTASGKYVPKELFEQELAARASFLNKDFENFFRSHVMEIINLVDGDLSKSPDLLKFCLEKKDEWLDRYAKQGEFTV